MTNILEEIWEGDYDLFYCDFCHGSHNRVFWVANAKINSYKWYCEKCLKDLLNTHIDVQKYSSDFRTDGNVKMIRAPDIMLPHMDGEPSPFIDLFLKVLKSDVELDNDRQE